MEEENVAPTVNKKLSKKLAREGKLIQLRKDTLARELALDEISLGKVKDKWYEKTLEEKIPEMQDNLRHILHYLEKLIEGGAFRRIHIEEERDCFAEKSLYMAQSHERALETLFEIYEKRVQDLHNAYNGMVTEKKSQADEEFAAIIEKEKITQENMHTMLYQMRETRVKREEMMNCDMFLKLDDEISKNTEIQETLRTKLERKMEKRWGEIMTTLNKYDVATKARRAEYIMLKSKDDVDSKIIHQQKKKTQKLFEQLEEMRRCLDDCYISREKLSLITDLREERTKFFNTFTELKNLLDEELEEDSSNLKQLTIATNSAISDLKTRCKRGEQILTLFRICRKFETQLEKVIPVGHFHNFPKAILPSEHRKKQRSRQETETDESSTKNLEDLSKELEVLDKFWRKVARVKLSKMSLEKCVENLEKENALLKRHLAGYLKEASKSYPSVLSAPKSIPIRRSL